MEIMSEIKKCALGMISCSSLNGTNTQTEAGNTRELGLEMISLNTKCPIQADI